MGRDRQPATPLCLKMSRSQLQQIPARHGPYTGYSFEEDRMPTLHLTPDQVLGTTRSVRKRLDFTRPIEPEVIRECVELALQAPTGGNRQGWHWLVVTDAAKCQALGD